MSTQELATGASSTVLDRMRSVAVIDGSVLDFDSTIDFLNMLSNRHDGRMRVKVTVERHVGQFDPEILNGGMLRGVESSISATQMPTTIWLGKSTDTDGVPVSVKIIKSIEVFEPQGW